VAPDELLLEREYEVTTRWRVRVDIPDRPGGIARMVRALATLHVYTVYLQVVGFREGTRTIDIGLIAPANVSAEVIRAAAESAGTDAHITSGSSDPKADMLARTLDGATQLVKHPETAPALVAALVAADGVEVIDATAGVDDRADVLRLQWTANQHVLLHRSWAPFARTEQARASAVLRLSAAIARLSGGAADDAVGWIDEVRGGTVWIRLARPEDADKVAAMHERCSERSRYQRYFSHQQWRDIQLRRLSGGHRGATLVAMSRDGDIVALGNVFPDSPGDSRTAEIALIVEDAHQGTGVGRALLRRMLQITPGMGFTEVVANVLAGNAGMLHLLESTGLAWTTSVTEGVAQMTATLDVV
jgi:RimJ/RimL family protein N-acetyltransferase